MQSNIKRKGVNYRPFDALEGFKDGLIEIDNKMLYEPKKNLSEDEMEEINHILKDRYYHHKIITIKYYYDGRYLYHTGIIKNIAHEILFKDQFKINLNDLIEVI